MKVDGRTPRILALLNEKVPIPQIARLLQISKVAVWKRIRKLEKQGAVKRISKTPAFFTVLLDHERKETAIMLSSRLDHRNLIHSTHRLKFSIGYKGRQPYKGATEIKPFGRMRTARQSIYKIGQVTIVAFKRKLNVWIHKPVGKLTTHQLINARQKAYLTLLEFTKEHGIALDGDLSGVLRSHHVVEHEQVNEGLKPVFEAHPEELEKRIGSKICKTSHKGKIEHEGISSELTGAHVAKNAEWIFTQFPAHFSMLAQAQGEYNTNIKLHLGVLQKMSDTLDKIQEKL